MADHGRLDALVNNADAGPYAPALERYLQRTMSQSAAARSPPRRWPSRWSSS